MKCILGFHTPKEVSELHALVDDKLVVLKLDWLVDQGREGGRRGELALEHGVPALDAQGLRVERKIGPPTSASHWHL